MMIYASIYIFIYRMKMIFQQYSAKHIPLQCLSSNEANHDKVRWTDEGQGMLPMNEGVPNHQCLASHLLQPPPNPNAT